MEKAPEEAENTFSALYQHENLKETNTIRFVVKAGWIWEQKIHSPSEQNGY